MIWGFERHLAWSLFYAIATSFAMAWSERAYRAYFSQERRVIKEKFMYTLSGRSRCDHCSKTISPYMLFPVLSYILSRGKTNCCKQRISSQYLYFEVGFLIYGGMLSYLGMPETSLGIQSMLLIPFFYTLKTDFKSQLIPIEATIFVFVLGVINLFMEGFYSELDLSLRLLPLLFWYSLLHLLRILSRYGLGLGDIFLSCALVLLLPFPINMFLPSFAAILGLSYMQLKKSKTKRNKIAFGPFLYFGFYCCSVLDFLGANVFIFLTTH